MVSAFACRSGTSHLNFDLYFLNSTTPDLFSFDCAPVLGDACLKIGEGTALRKAEGHKRVITSRSRAIITVIILTLLVTPTVLRAQTLPGAQAGIHRRVIARRMASLCRHLCLSPLFAAHPDRPHQREGPARRLALEVAGSGGQGRQSEGRSYQSQ